MKAKIQNLLKSLGLYHRVQASVLYDWYWNVADRRQIQKRVGEMDFYRTLLEGFRPGDVIFDVGANHGQKTDIFLRLGARVVSVEPDDSNQAILRQKFLWLRLNKRPMVVVGKAAGEECVTKTMYIDAPGSAKNSLSQKWVDTLRTDDKRFGKALEFASKKTVETTTLEHLIAAHGLPYFIKIDVEGYEPNAISGLKSPVPYLSFEANLPEFKPETIECVDLLAKLDPAGLFNFAVETPARLALPRWVDRKEFLRLFETCRESSIEVLFKSAAGQRAHAKKN